jgi:hypothetical protein
MKRKGFAALLNATLQKQSNKRKDAMIMFPYLKMWDEVAVRECCILSKVLSFKPSEILFDNYFFILLKHQLLQYRIYLQDNKLLCLGPHNFRIFFKYL